MGKGYDQVSMLMETKKTPVMGPFRFRLPPHMSAPTPIFPTHHSPATFAAGGVGFVRGVAIRISRNAGLG